MATTEAEGKEDEEEIEREEEGGKDDAAEDDAGTAGDYETEVRRALGGIDMPHAAWEAAGMGKWREACLLPCWISHIEATFRIPGSEESF